MTACQSGVVSGMKLARKVHERSKKLKRIFTELEIIDEENIIELECLRHESV